MDTPPALAGRGGALAGAGGGAPVGRELLELEAALLELEREQGAIEDDMATMDLLRDPGGERAAALERLRALERRRRDLIDTARARLAERLAGGAPVRRAAAGRAAGGAWRAAGGGGR